MDLARLAEKGQFAYIDGLSELFYAPPKTPAPSGPVPGRSPAVPGRTPQAAPRAESANLNRPSEIGVAKRLHLSGNGTAALDGLERDIVAVIEQLKNTRDNDEDESEVMLVVDQPDLLLGATGPGRGIGATEMMEWVMGLQQVGSGLVAVA